jgi:hypothetical protein
MSRPARVLAALVLAAACSLTPVEPIPLAGPAPLTVLVLPVRAGAVPPEAVAAIEAMAAPELGRRGYRALPASRARAALRARGLAPELSHAYADYAAVARELKADAVLAIRVEQWDAIRRPGLASFAHDVGYSLWDVRPDADETVLWELRSLDRWEWQPSQQPPAEPATTLEWYLGETPLRGGDPAERSDEDLARSVHRIALRRLPDGGE